MSSQNIANILVIRGAVRIGSVLLFLHPSLASAMEAFRRLPPLRPAVTLDRTTPTMGCTAPSAKVITVDSVPIPGHLRQDIMQIQLGNVPSNLLIVPPLPFSSLPPVPPAGETACCLVSAPATGAPVASCACDINSQLPCSYLQAALTPPSPLPVVLKTLKPLTASKGCFRCLALDHLVRDCRDPVRCRRCLASGHRSPACKMPFRRVLHALPAP